MSWSAREFPLFLQLWHGSAVGWSIIRGILLEEENSRMEVEEDDSDNIVEEPIGGPAEEELPLPEIAHMVDDEQEVVPV